MSGLLPEVDRAFERTGATTPGWPDPWPGRWADGEGPDVPDEAYSRCTEPQRYRILHTRVEAWVEVLESRGLVTARDVVPGELEWEAAVRPHNDLHRVRRLDPVLPGGLALVLATTLVDGAPFGLDVGVADAEGASFVEAVPDCGCDACDSGSADLLEVLDAWFLTVARGGVVHVRHDGASMTRPGTARRGTGRVRRAGWTTRRRHRRVRDGGAARPGRARRVSALTTADTGRVTALRRA